MLVAGYFERGFLSVQRAIDEAIARMLSPKNVTMDDILLSMKRFPYPPYEFDRHFDYLMPVIVMLILFVFSFGMANLIADVVYEKEKMLKVGIKLVKLSLHEKCL